MKDENSSLHVAYHVIKLTRAQFQYPIRRLIIRSRKVSKLRDLYLELSGRSDRSASSIFRRNLTIRRLIGYWNGARVQKNDQMQDRRRCECVSTAYPVEYGHIFAVIFCNPQLWWIHAEHRPIFFRAISWRWDNRKIVLLQLSQCQWTNPDYPSSRESYPEGWWKNPNHDKRRQESVPIFFYYVLYICSESN